MTGGMLGIRDDRGMRTATTSGPRDEVPTTRLWACSALTIYGLPTSAGASDTPEDVRLIRACDLGTSSLFAVPVVVARQGTADPVELTDPGASPDDTPTGAALSEIKRLGGLTWDQVAELFGVSRRAVHFWASGQPLAADNEAHVHQLISVLRDARHPADALRARLLGVVDGATVLSMLRARRYDDARAALGRGDLPPRPTLRLSPEASAARRPPPPDHFITEERDDLGAERGRTRPVRTRRSKDRDAP